jgi:DNA-binding response OmpR family regulator
MIPATSKTTGEAAHSDRETTAARSSANVAIVDDDDDQSLLLRQWVEGQGYRASTFDSAQSFRDALLTRAFDLAIIDWGLPDDDGPGLVKWLRDSRHSGLPVMLLTVRRKEADIVEGLRAGADDYMVKPARQGEFMARVGALLRRSGVGDDEAAAIDVGPYRLDLRRRIATIEGRTVVLTELEFDLAVFLFRRSGRISSREALLVGVWNLPPDSPSRTVDTHMSRLRRKLELNGENGCQISSVYHHGYRLECT